jgi:hypothetical protein
VHHDPVVTSTPQTTPQKRIKASTSMQAVVEAAPQDQQQSYLETSTRTPAAPSAVTTPTSTQSGRGRGTPRSVTSSVGSNTSISRSAGRGKSAVKRLSNTPEYDSSASPQLGNRGRVNVAGATGDPLLRSARLNHPANEPDNDQTVIPFDNES